MYDEDEEVKGNPTFHLIRCTFVEFIGDVLFVFIGTLAGSGGGTAGTLTPAFAHGLAIMVLATSMGHISGGFYNPSVTLGVFVSGNLPLVTTLVYIAAQLVGGFTGSLLARAVLSDNVTFAAANGGITIPNHGEFPINAWLICEIICTYFLVNTVLNAAVDKEGNNPLAPLAIGCTVAIDIISCGNISGASMNPARSLGPALCYEMFYSEDMGAKAPVWDAHWIYWVGPAIGATLAGLVYRTILAEGESRWLGKKSGQVFAIAK